MKTRREPWLKRLPALFEIPDPDPDPEHARQRIELMERNVMLPVKIFFLGLLFHTFSHSNWIENVGSTPVVAVETIQIISWFYIPASLILALPILFLRHLPAAIVQWTVFTNSLVDGLFIAGLCVISGGVDSILFWLFAALILRNSVSLPPGFSQLVLNFSISLCYVLVPVIDTAILSNTDDRTLQAMSNLSPTSDLTESFVLRLLVLWLAAITCHHVQVSLVKQSRMEAEAAEAAEFALRENQLHSAGRLAAEFAHQVKNPLAIINNCAHSLRRALGDRGGATAQQIEIIQEEVARANRVITQIMEYGRLNEGRVEKLAVTEEIERAIAQVYPAAMPTAVKIERDYAGPFPALLMQRGHLSEILVNLLQNAREALGANGGTVRVTAERTRDHAVILTIADDGPGIPPGEAGRIFEAYYTTKQAGTGLGLAIVKHNAELYGGSVRLESVLGKGAKFVVTFPAKTLPRPFVQ